MTDSHFSLVLFNFDFFLIEVFLVKTSFSSEVQATDVMIVIIVTMIVMCLTSRLAHKHQMNRYICLTLNEQILR
jgi:hypothetical protein